MDYEELVLQNHSKCKVMERLTVPELKNEVLQICHSTGQVQIEEMKMQEDGLFVSGVLYVNFLYIRANDEMPFAVWQGMIPFSHLVECHNCDEDTTAKIATSLEQLSVSLQGGEEIEVKAALAFHAFFCKAKKEELISQALAEPISISDIEGRPSFIGYIVKEGDTVWNLAKRYGTKVSTICKINQVEEGTLKAGDRLLIFKENMSIL